MVFLDFDMIGSTDSICRDISCTMVLCFPTLGRESGLSRRYSINVLVYTSAALSFSSSHMEDPFLSKFCSVLPQNAHATEKFAYGCVDSAALLAADVCHTTFSRSSCSTLNSAVRLMIIVSDPALVRDSEPCLRGLCVMFTW